MLALSLKVHLSVGCESVSQGAHGDDLVGLKVRGHRRKRRVAVVVDSGGKRDCLRG